MKWFNYETYDLPEPPDNHDLNLLMQNNTIKHWKKSFSFFMPNCLTAWNELSGVGNPTRSRQLTDLIRAVKKEEVQGQGAPSRARWACSIKGGEYHCVTTILKEEVGNIVWKYGIPAMMNYQFPHLIGRIDCATQAKLDNCRPMISLSLPSRGNLIGPRMSLKSKMPLPGPSSLGVWQPCILWTPYLFAFSDDTSVSSGGVRAKATFQNFFCGAIF